LVERIGCIALGGLVLGVCLCFIWAKFAALWGKKK